MESPLLCSRARRLPQDHSVVEALQTSRTITAFKFLALFTALLSAIAQVNNNDPDYATILDQCESVTTTVEDCKEIISQNVNETQVKVVVVHPRTLEDVYYNQVVIPVDYQGLVLGDGPAFNNMIYYPFQWRGAEKWGLGTRSIGPFNCTGMTGVQCCDTIIQLVPDQDINQKFVDCWLEESFLKTADGELLEVYRNAIDGSVNPLHEARIRRLEEREELERQELIREINSLGSQLHRSLFSKLTNAVRHALRGYPNGQGVHYIMKLQLRRTTADHIQIADNAELQAALQLILTCLQNLSLEGGLHRIGGVVEGENKDVIVLHATLDGMIVDEASFLDLTDET